ncbi:AlpA family phage regulatory protein [Sphingomonas sp. AOB5]|uniref:helix-turn-helix transcriptional regulator n=1 Tax=Sphingomonas sp. AOB5 TaxID=3034017 RepID=UPI0023F70FF1|nr:AlpA family phage regulatory protein [Sphingomonas sp. AOB5]MDF7777903.1 AlpA family phage regulatory protein [Sphingomonas sp. AOB5]
MQTEASDRILRIKTVLEKTGLSRSTMYRRMQEGSFPKSVQISIRCVGWREADVIAWCRSPMYYDAHHQP